MRSTPLKAKKGVSPQNRGWSKKTEGWTGLKNRGGSLAVGTYLQRGSAPPPPLPGLGIFSSGYKRPLTRLYLRGKRPIIVPDYKVVKTSPLNLAPGQSDHPPPRPTPFILVFTNALVVEVTLQVTGWLFYNKKPKTTGVLYWLA